MKLEVWMDSNGWVHACVRNAILAQNNYWAKPNPKTDSHSSSRVHSGIGTQAPQSNLIYYLATEMLTGLLTQPVNCEIGSSIFPAMTQLKVAGTISASFPIIPSTEMKKGEKSLLWL